MTKHYDIGEIIGRPYNYGYESSQSDYDPYSTNHGFLDINDLIFGQHSSGTANLYQYQQNNIAPTLVASSFEY